MPLILILAALLLGVLAALDAVFDGRSLLALLLVIASIVMLEHRTRKADR